MANEEANQGEYHWLPLPGGLGSAVNPRHGRSKARRPLLDGFLAGPENRLVEAIVHWILEGVPCFADSTLTRAPGKKGRTADLSDFPRASYPLVTGALANGAEKFPPVLDYLPCKNVPFLYPILFYGPTGCGKSFLLNGIYELYRKRYPETTGICQTGGDFHRNFVSALAKDDVNGFRGFFERSDIVVLDDLDALADHPSGQNELFVLLEMCRHTRTQVIVAMSEFPLMARRFDVRLAERLVEGMTVPIAFPGERSREIIVRRMLEFYRIELNPELVRYLVESLPLGVEGMHGAIMQMSGQLLGSGKEWTLPRIKTLLESRRTGKVWTVEEIAKKVAKHYSIKMTDMRGKSRLKTNVLARNMTIYLSRNLTDATLQELGRWFSNRDHTTILHGFRDIGKRLRTDAQTRKSLDELLGELDARDSYRPR